MRLALVLVVLLLQACMSIDPKHTTNPEWLNQYLADSETTAQPCLPPTGVFSNTGETNDAESQAPPLVKMLFADGLAGYPVEAIQIERIPGSERLQVTGILAGVPLKQRVNIEPGDSDCTQRWRLKVDTGVVDARMRTEAVMYTGALIMPLKETFHSQLIRASDGALLIAVNNSAWILGALSIPFKVESHFWLRYPLVDAAGNNYPVLSDDVFPSSGENADKKASDNVPENTPDKETAIIDSPVGTQ